MKRLWLFIAGLFLNASAFAQLADTLPLQVITLNDVSIVDFKNDNTPVFNSKSLSTHSQANKAGSDLGDLLQNTLPVYFKNYSVGGVKTIDFRGTGSERTKVYWNGIPINSPTLGGFDFSLLPFYFIEDARLRFGGASLTDGGGGLGGSVQLLNAAGFDNNSLELTGAYGSFGSYTLGGKALLSKGKFKSDSRIIFTGAKNNYTFTNEFKKDHPTEKRKNNQVKQLGFQQVFAYRFNKKHGISARFAVTNADRNLPPPVSSTGSGNSRQKDELFLSQVAWDWVPESRFYLKIRTGYQYQKNRYVQADFIDATTTVNAWNSHLDLGYNGIKNLKLNTSLRFDKYGVNSAGAGKVAENQFTGLLNADWQLINRLKFVFGLRVKTITGATSPVMPYGGLSWQIPQNGGSIRANVSQVYRFPTINDRYWIPGGNPELKPENGWNYELGYNFSNHFDFLKLQFGVTAFYSLINQWILWQPSAINAFIWEPQNIWKVNNKGIEGSIKSDFRLSENSNLSVGVNYTWASTTVAESIKTDDRGVGKQLILTPAHQLLVPVGWAYHHFNAAINYRFVSKRFTDRLNTTSLDPYHIVDMVLGYRFPKPGLIINFRTGNILNTSYQTVQGQPLPGINFNLELTWKIL